MMGDNTNHNLPWERIGRTAIAQAKKLAAARQLNLAQALVEMGFSSYDSYATMSQHCRVPFVDLTVFRPDQQAVLSLTADVARKYAAIGLKRDGDVLYVAVCHPPDSAVDRELAATCGCKVRSVIGEPAEIERMLARLYT